MHSSALLDSFFAEEDSSLKGKDKQISVSALPGRFAACRADNKRGLSICVPVCGFFRALLVRAIDVLWVSRVEVRAVLRNYVRAGIISLFLVFGQVQVWRRWHPLDLGLVPGNMSANA